MSAASAKARKARTVPLSTALVAELRPHLSRTLAEAPVFKVPGKHDSAAMIRADLADTREAWLKTAPAHERADWEKSNFLRYKDDQGRHLDFHAFRHTRGVWLFEHYKAHPREVQELMGVSSLSLVDRYTQSFRLTDLAMIERGPDLSLPQQQTLRPTGTYGKI